MEKPVTPLHHKRAVSDEHILAQMPKNTEDISKISSTVRVPSAYTSARIFFSKFLLILNVEGRPGRRLSLGNMSPQTQLKNLGSL